jgi:hypothetical protein
MISGNRRQMEGLMPLRSDRERANYARTERLLMRFSAPALLAFGCLFILFGVVELSR